MIDDNQSITCSSYSEIFKSDCMIQFNTFNSSLIFTNLYYIKLNSIQNIVIKWCVRGCLGM